LPQKVSHVPFRAAQLAAHQPAPPRRQPDRWWRRGGGGAARNPDPGAHTAACVRRCHPRPRVDQVYREQQEWLAVCEEQLRRWRQDRPTPAEEREIGRLAEEIERLKPIVAEILALSAEIRTGTIDRIMEMSDAEIGLKALLGQLPRPF
jgi:hypothetical protein